MTSSTPSPIQASYISRPEAITQQYLATIQADFERVLLGHLPEVHHINVYAEQQHVHPTHLSNTIKEQTGFSPCDWINTLYLDEAKRLLATTQLTIAQISEQLSFGEATNFSKYFKKHVGISPKGYRTRLSLASN
jgi:AraC family transcriptional regulator, regulatory protein of adaptative response / methylphosphotriester-DNA alkyltransferase methyltransferase